jgi:predicted XRE-type DNA-binding protein
MGWSRRGFRRFASDSAEDKEMKDLKSAQARLGREMTLQIQFHAQFLKGRGMSDQEILEALGTHQSRFEELNAGTLPYAQVVNIYSKVPPEVKFTDLYRQWRNSQLGGN